MKPNLQQQRDFLFQTYFGGNGDELDRFISRAYRDLNRTFSGVGKLDSELKTQILNGAKKKLREQVVALCKDEGVSLDKFNTWHDSTCKALKDYYGESLPAVSKAKFTYGQAQKWVNMAMKYCWVCGGVELDDLQPWFPMAHVAVDEVILIAALEEKAVLRRPCEKWSKWDIEQEYKDFQLALRNAADKENKTPLELEFTWWKKYRSRLKKTDE